MARHAVAERIDRSPPSRGLIIGLAVAALAGAIVVAVLIPILTDRGSSSSVSATASQAPAVVSAGQQSTQSGEFKRPAGSVQIGDILLSGISVRTLDVRPAESHLKYVAIEATVRNVGTSPERIGEFYLKDANGASAHLASSDDELAQLGNLKGEILKFWGVTLAPGETAKGVVVFKILKDTKPAELTYVPRSGNSGVIPLK